MPFDFGNEALAVLIAFVASILGVADADQVAVRGQSIQIETPATSPAPPPPTPISGPSGTSVEGRCTQYEPLLIEHAPPFGWDVARMSAIMWRESRCTAEVRSSTRDSGLLQINDINHQYLRGYLGEHVDRWTLLDPVQNIRAGAALCVYWVNAGSGCLSPWKATR